MSEPILVASKSRNWDGILVIVLGIAFWIGSGVALGHDKFVAVLLLVIGTIILATGIITLIYRALTRRWVTILPKGFAYRDLQRTTEYRDEDVACISLHHVQNYSGGEYKSTTRRFTVWVEDAGQTRKILMTTTRKPNEADPLQGLVERIANQLTEAGRKALQRGEPVEGVGWRLERHELHGKDRNRNATIHPISELTAADIFDEKLCVWIRGQDEPQIRIPIESPNAHLLLLLLQEMIKKDDSQPPPEGQLGRILFERRANKTYNILGWLMTAAAAGLGLLLILAAVITRKPDALIPAACCLGFAALFGFISFHFVFAAFRCHEYGVCVLRWWGKRQIRYTDVESFTYSATRMYYNGAYTGTAIVLGFKPLPGVEAKAIQYQATLQKDDPELENLRVHISRVIAGRMAREFADKKPVVWLPHLKFLPEGLEYRPSGFISRKDPIVIPYGEVQNFDLEQGVFHLWRRDNNKSVIDETVGQPNFFPGFVLLSMIFSPPDEDAPT